LVNPILAKYSPKVACEDALHMAIRSYNRGVYDGKINASKYNVLLNVMAAPQQLPVMPPMGAIMAKKKVVPKKDKSVSQSTMRSVMRRLNIMPQDVPLKSPSQKKQRSAPRFIKKPGTGYEVEEGK
jgi:hypothetical protein